MDNWFDPKTTRHPWTFAPDRPRPVIFLRELRLLASLDAEPIRRVEFHPGLNIIWADPKVQEARKGGPRLAGHSAGKTTLCRILRWLLGEAHFGSEDTVAAVATTFTKGWALLRVELNGQPWVVGRSFWDRSNHRAARNVTLDDVQKIGWPNPDQKNEFFDELKRLTLAPLVRQRFPGAKDDVAFTDLLAWLARDQEAALQRVDSWRSPTSGKSQFGPDRENRHVLMRLVLQLLEDTEWQEMEKCANLEVTKDTWKKKEPSLAASAKAACEPLARLVGGETGDLTGPLLISSAEELVAEKERKLSTLRAQLAGIGLKALEEDLEKAIVDLAKGDKEVEIASRTVKNTEKRVSERNADLINTKARAMAQARGIPPGFCARERSEAEGKCPLYKEAPQNIAAAQTTAEIEKQRDHLQEALDDQRQELIEAQNRIPFLKEKEALCRLKRDEAIRKRDLTQSQIADLKASLKADREVLHPAKTRQTALENCESELSILSENIKESVELQRAIRQSKWPERIEFGDVYRTALRQLTSEDANETLQFDSKGLFDLETTGAAVTALKVLAFDLAAMLWSASGKSHHPRLLIHDSPRVADMSPVPYAAIFDLVAAAENDANGAANFQYIITTTESPPEELRDHHLVLTLDASREDGLLFKKSFTQ